MKTTIRFLSVAALGAVLFGIPRAVGGEVSGAALPGDSFSGPIRIFGVGGRHVIGDNSGYSVEDGEPWHTLDGETHGPQYRTVWHLWTAPGTGTMEFRTASSGDDGVYPTSVTVYEGDSLDSIQRIAFANSPDLDDPAQSTPLVFRTEKGRTYRIVGMVGCDETGSFVLSWDGQLATGTGTDYLLTLDWQGGTEGTAKTVATCGEALPDITVPTRAGYSFGGYYSGTDGAGTLYYTAAGESAQAWDVAGDATLYAKWMPSVYRVTLDPQGGAGGTTSVAATYGSAMPGVTAPTRPGYAFGGYYDGTNGTGTAYYTATGGSANPWNQTGARTLYAKWTPNAYAVTLDREGGTGGTASVTATYGAAMPDITAPTRTGYAFGGYYGGTNGTGTAYYTAAGKSAHAWDVAGAQTLHAKWTQNAPGTNHYALCVGVNTYKSTYLDPSFRLEGCVLDANRVWTNITKRGKWTAANATRLLNSSATKAAIRKAITNIAAKAVSGDVFFYYHSSHGGNDYDNYDVYLCSHDADYTDQELASDLAQFASGVKVVVMVDACYSGGLFKPAKKKSMRRASSTGFDLAQRVSASIDALRAGTRKGRKGMESGRISSGEIGWLTSADYNQDSWESAAGGEFTGAAIQGWTNGVCDSAKYGNRDGYANFYELWNYAKDISVGHAPPAEDRTDAQCLNTNVLLATIAGWVGPNAPGASYTIRLDPQGGTGGTTSATARYGAAMPAIKVPTRTGYAFGGYYSGANGAGTAYYTASGTSARTWNVAGTATLYAKWTARPYTVAFDAAGGAGKMAKQKMTYGKAAALRKNAFTRKGFVFAGWSKKKGGAVAFGNGAKAKNLSATGGTVKLYAKWAKKNYSVAFNGNGGTGKMAKQKMTYGKAAALRKNAFKRKGHTFLGWAKTKKGAVAYKNGAKVKNLRLDGKTTTLYAKWAKNAYKVAFDANGGTGTMGAQKMTYGKAVQLKGNVFRREGYTFAGWAKTKTGAVAYKNGAKVKNLRTDGKTMTLYAQWQANAKGAKRLSGRGTGVATTTIDGSDGSAVADGDERTGWTPGETEAGAWVVLSFEKARDVAEVEVVGENLPEEGMRVLLSEDAETWREGVPGAARYVWVAFPEGSEGVDLREVRVVERK